MDRNGVISWDDFYGFCEAVREATFRNTTERQNLIKTLYKDMCASIIDEATVSIRKIENGLFDRLKEVLEKFFESQATIAKVNFSPLFTLNYSEHLHLNLIPNLLPIFRYRISNHTSINSMPLR